jgi:hypothetical protein
MPVETVFFDERHTRFFASRINPNQPNDELNIGEYAL